MNATPPESGLLKWAVSLSRGELLDLVLQIEERMRRLIRVVLSETRSDWEKLIPDKIRTDIESSGPSPKAGADILDRASLNHLIGIAVARWQHFSDLLGDKPTFQVRTNEFRKWRNSLAHGTSPSPDEKVEIVILVKQVGQQIPVVPVDSPGGSMIAAGSIVVWVDDNPEWNLSERQILRALGIEVIPVLTNDEAVAMANNRQLSLVISDIDHGEAESGDKLPGRFAALGIDVPTVFYIGAVDPERGAPPGGVSIQDDPALLVRDVLNLLSQRS